MKLMRVGKCQIIQAAAKAAVLTVGPVVGIDPISVLTLIASIIQAVVPELTQCLGKTGSPQEAQQIVTRHYHPGNNRYDRSVLMRFKQKAKAANVNGSENLTDAQHTAIAIASMDQLRSANDQQLMELSQAHQDDADTSDDDSPDNIPDPILPATAAPVKPPVVKSAAGDAIPKSEK